MESSKTTIGEATNISCLRCRRRKIKCDRGQPCAQCVKAGTDCARPGTGEKQRPITRNYVSALENQVASLELFIQKLSIADADERDVMLRCFPPNNNTQDTFASPGQESKDTAKGDVFLETALPRSSAGQMLKQSSTTSSQFYGGTSLFQIPSSGDASVPIAGPSNASLPVSTSPLASQSPLGSNPGYAFPFAPHDDVCQRLMARFFKLQYQYYMCVYREYFLRDYDRGTGPYYSDLLLYVICSLGALASSEPVDRGYSDIFANHAELLLYGSLDKPDLTVLQALVLFGQREVGCCRPSKGWLLCGMAFRLAHEMGLHLDPVNFCIEDIHPNVDREILRRAYWAAFIVDKQLSLYFGRPPALYPHESDVRRSVRLPYPQDSEGLLETYIESDKGPGAYEDGAALVGSFIYRAELAKIQHRIIADLYENRRPGASSDATTAATVQQIHASLTKWLSNLPGKLHWNQWTIGHVTACVLHLHMQFHTAMIILHRPPRTKFPKAGISLTEDVETCYESLQALCCLMRRYSRSYRYAELPVDFVHTLSVAASVVLMRRHLDKDATAMEREMTLIREAMRMTAVTWPCVLKVEQSVAAAATADGRVSVASWMTVPAIDTVADVGFMSGLLGAVDEATWARAMREGGSFGDGDTFDESILADLDK